MINNNYTTIPLDFVRFYKMDWNSTSVNWVNNATSVNPIWTATNFAYNSEQLSWQASTSFTYPSVTYTNSYLFKNGEVIKNSSEVTATAVNGVNGNTYQWVIFFNRSLTSFEEKNLEQYIKRRLGPLQSKLSNWFKAYSTNRLENWKILEISKAQSWWVYYDQTGNGNNSTSIVNVTDSADGIYNVMSFNWTSSRVILNTLAQSWDFTYIMTIDTTLFTTDNRMLNQEWNRAGDFSWGLASWWNHRIIRWTWSWSNFQIWTWTNNLILSWKKTRIWVRYSWWVMSLFTNWIKQDVTPSTWSSAQSNSNTTIWYYTAWPRYFNWDISKPEMYNRALSDEEILEDYYSTFIPN